MSQQQFFVEIHTLRNVPAANLNRDQNNQPKTAYFGGALRSRISAQAIKRAVRQSPEFDNGVAGIIGTRTKHLAKLVSEILVKDHAIPGSDATAISEAVIGDVGFGAIKEGKTSVLVYISNAHIAAIADIIASRSSDLIEALRAIPQTDASDEEGKTKGKSKKKKEAKGEEASGLQDLTAELKKAIQNILVGKSKNVKSVGSVDIALFGRMLAEFPELNVDAASQVAHLISTNQLKSEFDFFTAVDDINEEEGTQGAGMMGLTGYNSACFYGYSVVDVPLLVKNLGNDVELSLTGLAAYLRAYALALPSGKQTSFAAHTPPSLVMVVVRQGSAPVSLANAFEAPVRPDVQSKDGKSLVENSVKKLGEHWSTLDGLFGSGERSVFTITSNDRALLGDLQNTAVKSLDALIDSTVSNVKSKLGA
ncbi:MAG: type I-E CRISPR-associated protein Cas7/Cse4/CasC ['Candidatus Kapabacteria' thiocyanatum]|uniref:Type I-E CRISPR-associated protein Cas7/Cse4/CasC n=1 Tax=Candidatus Kapaibacterium thiocyanatum TaxID=1895771 RepID=A0A1M3L5W6_9BACT|nr:type I-E CRISPR-associated protein Cas7/Cse4/CasC ['Candidatus Kapabacteria' thiocyanatum]OJX60958.1 MAG: type I-E CRISPR-associated protein Cas7/Cse4/CasC ['Candidatus Kapabacteria' thiocyanatum]